MYIYICIYIHISVLLCSIYMYMYIDTLIGIYNLNITYNGSPNRNKILPTYDPMSSKVE